MARAAGSRGGRADRFGAGGGASDPSASRSVANATTVSSARNSAERHPGPAAEAGAEEEWRSGANGERLSVGAVRVGRGNMCSGE
jgi:hypothetical protein